MITMQSAPVMTGSNDREGRLIFSDDALVAVIVCLSMDQHEHIRGKWFLEAGFGPCHHPCALFDSPDDAAAWVRGRLRLTGH